MAGVKGRRRVFISSAQGGLMPYREAAAEVCRRWGYEPVVMEDLVPERTSPADWSRDRVLGCDAYILLLGHRYGSLVPETEISYSELEYETALGVPGMPILVWTVDPDLPWLPGDIDFGQQKERLDRFKARVAEHVRGAFGDLAVFRENVLVALRALDSSWQDGGPEASEPELARASLLAAAALPQAPAAFASPAYVGSLEFTGRHDELAWLDAWARSEDAVAVVEALGGTGKSALTWAWFHEHAPAAVPNLAGRFWWSLYDPANSIDGFQRSFLAYATGCSFREAREMEAAELESAVLRLLDESPYVVVLDGCERLLNAYHRFDAGVVSDAEVEELRIHHARAVSDPRVHTFLRRLSGVRHSKVLTSTRLVPDSFVGYGDFLLPNVRHLPLRGMAAGDVCALLDRLDVRYSGPEVRAFLGRLGYHPLLIGLVIGMVRRYRAAPGDFRAWLADPSAGGAFRITDLPLTAGSHHILEQSLAGLDERTLRVLQRISVPIGASTWEMVQAINPFRESPPEPPPEWAELPGFVADFLWTRRQTLLPDQSQVELRALARLDAALAELQDRGLLWWDQESNTYDLHPVVRAFVADTTDDSERRATNESLVRDHFGRSRTAEDPHTAESSTDLLYTSMFFHALVGTGAFRTAEKLWFDRLGPPLVWRLGAHIPVIELLEPFIAFAEEAGFRTNLRWDLAIALGGVGRRREAMELELHVLRLKLEEGAPASVVMSALNNVSASAWASGHSALSGRCEEVIRELTSVVGDQPDALGRIATIHAHRLARAGDHAGVLDLVEQAAGGPVNSMNPYWTGEWEEYRLRALIGLGRHAELEPVHVDEYRFGTEWVSRLTWCEFVWDYAIDRGDYALALEASRERQRWNRFLGREPLPAATARALAHLGQLEEAEQVLEAALVRFEQVEFADRPHLDAAYAMLAIGRGDEAVPLALDAYRQAWADGPSTHLPSRVSAARALLEELGLEVPDLPTTEPADVAFPLAEELRAYIERVRAGDIPPDYPSA